MKKLSVSEAAVRLDVSVRTLHYYDEIGLLTPERTGDGSYRCYSEEEIGELSRIVFLRELDIPLKEIKRILSDPSCDKTGLLINHRELLKLKRQRLDGMIKQLDETIGGKTVSKQKVTAADIEAAKKKYAGEVKERWGETEAYKESEAKHAGMSSSKEAEIADEANEIFAAFAEVSGSEPGSAEAQALVRRWQEHITKHHYNCTKEILACLGEMYVADERFTENIDRFGEGTAEFMSKAIKAYCN